MKALFLPFKLKANTTVKFQLHRSASLFLPLKLKANTTPRITYMALTSYFYLSTKEHKMFLC